MRNARGPLPKQNDARLFMKIARRWISRRLFSGQALDAGAQPAECRGSSEAWIFTPWPCDGRNKVRSINIRIDDGSFICRRFLPVLPAAACRLRGGCHGQQARCQRDGRSFAKNCPACRAARSLTGSWNNFGSHRGRSFLVRRLKQRTDSV